MSEPGRRPWGVVLAAIAVLAFGSWMLWDMKPWVKNTPVAKPASTLHILGRDDEPTKKAEAELESPASAQRSAAPPPSAAPPSSAR